MESGLLNQFKEYFNKKLNKNNEWIRLKDYENEHFQRVYRFGPDYIELNNNEKIAIYALEINDNLKNNKEKLNNLIDNILNNLNGGLFIFFNKIGDFRFSFIKPLKDIKKSYSYFVQFDKENKLFKDALEKLDFKDLENAFQVKPLIKQFYKEIQDWYEYALSSEEVYFPGGSKEENLIRLITRVIFIWFLKQMNLVPKEIFEEEYLIRIVKDFKRGDNYYNVILQNLFFEVLNTPLNQRGFNIRFKNNLYIRDDEFINLFRSTPYINGGLFEYLNDNEKYRAKIPDYFFFNSNPKGLINILKEYNFTVHENTPLDIEVSLDPELLGYIFENLLSMFNKEVSWNSRKNTGSYYTPKEIVDYMIEECLLEYFKNHNLDESKIKQLLTPGVQIDLNEEEIDKIIKAISEIKIIDPAVGSGAFLIGALNKLTSILEKIDPENIKWRSIQLERAHQEIQELYGPDHDSFLEQRLKEINETFDINITYPNYGRKLYIIQNSLYGVDIQPIAIQIAKLRFFLSLIIEQKPNYIKENLGIIPLPDLNTKLVVANSLFKLNLKNNIQNHNNEIENIIKELSEIYRRHHIATSKFQKMFINEKIEKLKETLKNNSNKDIQKLLQYEPFKQHSKTDWFEPEWMFGVKEFDIIISNPPYVRQERIKDIKPRLKEEYKTYDGRADLYVYFYERAYNLAKQKGIVCYITSNKWMKALYGKNLREFILKNTKISKIIDFKGYYVFAQSVDTCIVIFRKDKDNLNNEFYYINNVPSNLKSHSEAIEYIRKNLKSMPQSKLSKKNFMLGDDKLINLKEKINRIGVPLEQWGIKIRRGVTTGFNKAFLIDEKKKEEILKNCKTEEERKRTEEIMKPVLRGRDIERYYYKWAGLYLIKIDAGWTNKNRGTLSPEEFFKTYFQALYEHMLSFKNKKGKGMGIFNRDAQGDYWWELRPCSYYHEFEEEKIVWSDINYKVSFSYTRPGWYILDTAYFLTGKNIKYVLGVLNSKVINWYIRNMVYALKGKAYRLIEFYIEIIPVPPITPQNQHIVQRIEKLVNEILEIKSKDPSNDTSNLEKEIDKLVYELYNLTDDEIKLIEESTE